MPKESMSTEGETLQVSVLPCRCSICPPLHRHNWLSFGKFQDTERFLIPCQHHVSSRLPPSGETCKYAMVPSTHKKNWRDSLPIDMLLSAVSVLVVGQPSSEIPERLMNHPVLPYTGPVWHTFSSSRPLKRKVICTPRNVVNRLPTDAASNLRWMETSNTLWKLQNSRNCRSWYSAMSLIMYCECGPPKVVFLNLRETAAR